MLKQFEHNGFLFVEVHSRAIIEVVNFDAATSWIRWYVPDFSENGNINLPSGNWQILCKANECSEWEATRMVETIKIKMPLVILTEYRDYLGRENYEIATLSLRSLILSHEMQLENTLILKKQANETTT